MVSSLLMDMPTIRGLDGEDDVLSYWCIKGGLPRLPKAF